MVLSGLVFLFAAQGSVHVVDAQGGPGSTHTTLATAVSAAATGDVLLVRAGDYAQGASGDGLRLEGKGLIAPAAAAAN